MGTPIRRSLLDAIATQLATITSGNGYKSTVDTVQQFVRTRDDVKPGELPYIAFGIESEDYEHDYTQHIRVKAQVVVVGYVAGSATWATMSTSVNNLIDDIIVCMVAGFNNSTYAVQCRVVSGLTDEWDPDQGSDIAAAVLRFEIIYNRETTAS